MKILITGISGFVGSHLAEYCLKQGDKVYGTILSHHLGDEVKHLKGILGQLTLRECNLMNRSAVFKVLNEVKPDIIFHLAAHSFVPFSWKEPQEALQNNIISELNIFETLVDLDLKDTVIQIAGSSEEYGLVHEDEIPIKESNKLRPLSPYAVSKIGQEYLAKQYYMSYGLKTVITRAFNHEGPRRGQAFVTSNFAKQIVEIEKTGMGGCVNVGNLEAIRDFTDVRDMIRAYYLAVTSDKIKYGEEYNICSGKGITMREMLNILISLSTVNIVRNTDSKRMRPSDVPVLIGNCDKFKEATEWKSEIKLEKTLRDTLDYWRNSL
ncbi:MAG: GDP-mannose 4,6-dehydratase [Candidatus Lokiarchaeota archaeon]|nr:GDP-mannose 4,6-dehydratase [Candidatus Lokiarchaeota archaeon]